MSVEEFRNLFVFDIANNHQGQVDHGLNIIQQFAKVASTAKVKATLKFQMRHLPTFIHESAKTSNSNPANKLIERFTSTSLSLDGFKMLKQAAEDYGLLTACTPFDEESVRTVAELDFDYLKIASCSANDWPLIKEICRLNKPIIASTGGLSLTEIDSLVELLRNKRKDFALMHCVSLYPTPDHKLSLNQIRILKDRYRNLEIGWSTHENPEQYDAIKMAYALGARIFERHIGLAENGHKLNSYSSTPNQIAHWLEAHKSAVAMCGSEALITREPEELSELKKLKRGVFSTASIDHNSPLTPSNTRFAFPVSENQILTSEWRENLMAQSDLVAGSPIQKNTVQLSVDFKSTNAAAVNKAFEILKLAGIAPITDSSIEISHHYGLENFHRYGAVIFNCVNRDYCRKMIVLTAGQEHPSHFHKTKDETFFLAWGDLEIELDGVRKFLKPGDQIVIQPKVRHRFWTLNGAIIDEVSTTHQNGDSVYDDEAITAKEFNQRKSLFPN